MTHQPTLRPVGKGRTVAIVGDVYRFLATGENNIPPARGVFR